MRVYQTLWARTFLVAAVSVLLWNSAAAGTGTWQSTSAPLNARFRAQSATLLDGRVLIAGGQIEGGGAQRGTSACELFDPTTETFDPATSMSAARYLHTAATLPDGRVLVAGGVPDGDCDALSQCELFDATSGVWSDAASLPVGLSGAAMVVLSNGKALLTGGGNFLCGPVSNDCYLFDSTANGGAGSWTATGSMQVPRLGHKLVALDDGDVLAIGGRYSVESAYGSVATELYTPATGTWRETTGGLQLPRGAYLDSFFGATKLGDGRVLITGGITDTASSDDVMSETEIYDPSTGIWTVAAPLPEARELHDSILLDDGRVLVAGGQDPAGLPLLTSRIYDPVYNFWGYPATMNQSRVLFHMSRLPDGRILAPLGSAAQQFTGLLSAEIFDPPTAVSIPADVSITLVDEPHLPVVGSDLVYRITVTNNGPSSATVVQVSDLLDPNVQFETAVASQGSAIETSGAVSAQLGMLDPGATATLEITVKTLIAGDVSNSAGVTANETDSDHTNNFESLISVVITNQPPGVGQWHPASPPSLARFRAQSATLLDGRILTVGGQIEGGGAQSGTTACEIFDPATSSFSTAASMFDPRYLHSVVRLPDGRVLAAGGVPNGSCDALASCEIFNPDTGLWIHASSLPVGSSGADMVVLPNGFVLLAGGGNFLCGPISNSCYLFDPSAFAGVGAWMATGSMGSPRLGHRLVLLDDGQVLAIGGRTSVDSSLGTVATELYNPVTGSWSTTTGSLLLRRGAYLDSNFAATKLADGRVLVSGGSQGAPTTDNTLDETEIYDPATGLWSKAATMPETRELHDAVLLGNGKVLMAGGQDAGGHEILNSYLYDPTTNSWGSPATMNESRVLYHMSLLPDGRVLAPLGSGAQQFTGLLSAEIYDPAAGAPAQADVSVSVVAGPNPVNAGEQLLYTITVTNNGPSQATGVQLSDVLDPGVTYTSGTTTQGSLVEGDGTVTAQVGTLASGASATIQVSVGTISAGEVANSAAVFANETDPNHANNFASQTATVVASEPLISFTWTRVSQSRSGRGLTTLRGSFRISNQGSADSPPFVVGCFLSESPIFDPQFAIPLNNLSISALKTRRSSSKSLTANVAAKGKFIIAVVDLNHDVLGSAVAKSVVVFGPIK